MRRRGVKTTLSWGPCFRLLWSLLSLSLLVPAVSGEVHQRFRPTDTTRLQDTATITDTHLTDTGWLHFLTLTDTGLLGSQDTQDVGTHPTSKTLVERRVSETWTGSSLSQSADSTNTINLVTPAMEHYLFHLNSIKRLRFPKRNNKPEINKLVNTIRKKTKLIHRNILNKRKKYNKRRRIRRNSSTFSYSTLLENDTQSAHSTNTTRGRNNQDRRQETARHPLRRRTDRARVWTDKYPDSDKRALLGRMYHISGAGGRPLHKGSQLEVGEATSPENCEGKPFRKGNCELLEQSARERFDGTECEFIQGQT
ncbi:uncharacterized protein LOC121871946 isoform X5 [Homarus americanus]|uniref:uncharacterized protein LOC121871946 isoform X5 n=1 Tax=Homarus americanus TaxID=6706 RepID=UPI001C45FD94|nr:uncharacterized protein LOC121871946 isoform X5 [Homarus americanus]